MKKVILYFEGVYCESDVWLNGKPLGHHVSGYTSFSYDITELMTRGFVVREGVLSKTRISAGDIYDQGTDDNTLRHPGGEVQVTATVRNQGRRKAEALPVPVLLNGQPVFD